MQPFLGIRTKGHLTVPAQKNLMYFSTCYRPGHLVTNRFGDGVCILYGHAVQLARIHMEPPASILFSHQYSRRVSRIMCWLYEVAGQKVADLPAHLILLFQAQPVRGLPDLDRPLSQGISFWRALVRTTSCSLLLNTSLYWRSKCAITRCSLLIVEPSQAPLYKSVTFFEAGPLPPMVSLLVSAVDALNGGPHLLLAQSETCLPWHLQVKPSAWRRYLCTVQRSPSHV